MAGLLVKELMIRGDVERCLVVGPGVLVEQWQDELHDKFGLPFDILTCDRVETSRTANPFTEHNLLIARLDMLSRDPELQSKLAAAKEWDLVVCDEAHRMSASFFGGEVEYTKRHQLGQLLGGIARHFVLMTATPHSGKEEDFQLFMALLDGTVSRDVSATVSTGDTRASRSDRVTRCRPPESRTVGLVA